MIHRITKNKSGILEVDVADTLENDGCKILNK